MTRIVTLMCVLCFVVTLNVAAQKNTDENTIKKWIAGNASALGFSAADVNNTRVASFYYDKFANVTMAYLQQTYKGVDVYNGLTSVAFRDGKVISVTSSRISDVDQLIINKNAKATVEAAQALRNAASEIGLSPQGAIFPIRKTIDNQEFEYDKLGIAFNNIIVRLMWTSTEDDPHLKLSWQVGIHTLQSNDYWLIKVDAFTGKILRKENLKVKCNWSVPKNRPVQCYEVQDYKMDRVAGEKGIESINSAKYKVIPYPNMDPEHIAPTLVTNPWTIFPNTNATTLKWNSDGTKDYDSTRGNNVLVQEDRNGNNGFGKGGHSTTSLPDLTFSYTFDSTKQPTDSLNLGFAYTNLFYWNNMLHDMEYSYGFDEASGNFQQNNLSRGGIGNDYVLADAEDGSSANNSNFSTPVDGQNPRMQMFLWQYLFNGVCQVNQPTSFAGPKPAPESAFSSNNSLINKGPITGNVVLFNDNLQGTTHQACVKAANSSSLIGNIALIDRGNCNFTVKVMNAQKAGAKAVIVVNNVAGAPIIMGGSNDTITIPAVMVSQSVGDSMKQFLSSHTTVNVTLTAGLYRDGDLDNSIISHEYFHGVSNRLTGGANNVSCLQNKEQMGEGWSDYNALMMTTDWSTALTTDGGLARPIGNYAGYDFLVRYYPYSTNFSVNPWTYDSLKSSIYLNTGEPHAIGEVWCEMLWEMTWEIIKTEGINKTFWDPSKAGGNSVAMKLVIEGMKLQKCSPGFVDGRDAILKADTVLFGGKYSPAIWRAFARRGLGYSASEGSSNSVTDGTAAYDLPLALPVVWGNFTAEKINGSAVLKWTTVTEINADRFVVEKTVDGINYAEIGSVKAIGNSTSSQSYTFTDTKPVRGVNSYRIKMIDNDGRYNYSEVRSLTFDDIKNIFSVAPNPAKDKVILTVEGNQKTLQVKLYNALGQQIAAYILAGETLTMDVSKFSAGAYYISVTGEGINQKEKLIIE